MLDAKWYLEIWRSGGLRRWHLGLFPLSEQKTRAMQPMPSIPSSIGERMSSGLRYIVHGRQSHGSSSTPIHVEHRAYTSGCSEVTDSQPIPAFN